MKEAAYTLVFLLALASGIGWTRILTGRFINPLADAEPMRSCQVKEVDAHGRIFWTPCNEWLSTDKH